MSYIEVNEIILRVVENYKRNLVLEFPIVDQVDIETFVLDIQLPKDYFSASLWFLKFQKWLSAILKIIKIDDITWFSFSPIVFLRKVVSFELGNFNQLYILFCNKNPTNSLIIKLNFKFSVFRNIYKLIPSLF